jgi:hypothetical protein
VSTLPIVLLKPTIHRNPDVPRICAEKVLEVKTNAKVREKE